MPAPKKAAPSAAKKAAKPAPQPAANSAAKTAASKTAAGKAGPTPPLAWSEADLRELAALLDAVPAPLEPLDVMMLDGFLAAVSLLPGSLPPGVWLPHVLDIDARPVPKGYDPEPLRNRVVARQRELRKAIDARQWFDPWVFELDEGEAVLDAIQPWAAGFALAVDAFDSPMQRDEPEVLEHLAVIYRAIDPDDLEDADDLLALMEEMEPPPTLADAVEDVVAAIMHLADVTRPQRLSGR